MKNYIELMLLGGDPVYIKADTISVIRKLMMTGSTITVMSGDVINVKESIDDIKTKLNNL